MRLARALELLETRVLHLTCEIDELVREEFVGGWDEFERERRSLQANMADTTTLTSTSNPVSDLVATWKPGDACLVFQCDECADMDDGESCPENKLHFCMLCGEQDHGLAGCSKAADVDWRGACLYFNNGNCPLGYKKCTQEHQCVKCGDESHGALTCQ
ncbi:hypothetical protein BC830DRAFT_1166794 [Chytriomyces sp. MP71]|nr:hypothetical protein BC830DRAFT_1166794 [Chytriomyces sp. MP71]